MLARIERKGSADLDVCRYATKEVITGAFEGAWVCAEDRRLPTESLQVFAET
jgi:hypothetical protein